MSEVPRHTVLLRLDALVEGFDQKARTARRRGQENQSEDYQQAAYIIATCAQALRYGEPLPPEQDVD